jgi:hypothetical protein
MEMFKKSVDTVIKVLSNETKEIKELNLLENNSKTPQRNKSLTLSKL